MSAIWVYGEVRAGRPGPVALELISKAKELGEATAILLGADAEAAAGVAGEYGASSTRSTYVDPDCPASPMTLTVLRKYASVTLPSPAYGPVVPDAAPHRSRVKLRHVPTGLLAHQNRLPEVSQLPFGST